MIEVPAQEGFEIARSLVGKYKLAILSNQMKFKTDYIKANNDLSFVDGIFFSSEMGTRKPSKKLFKIVLDTLQEKPMNCLFVDDNEENTKVATKLGLKTILCKDVSKLRRQIWQLC